MITLVNTTWENRESVLFQPVLKAYPTHHSWMITAHVSLGNMDKQCKLFTRQMIRTHQLLTCLLQRPSALTQLLTALEAELSNLNRIHTSYQPLIQTPTQLLMKEPSFDGIPASSKCMKRSLLPFLGDTQLVNRHSHNQGCQCHQNKDQPIDCHSTEPTGDPSSHHVYT